MFASLRATYAIYAMHNVIYVMIYALFARLHMQINAYNVIRLYFHCVSTFR